MYRDTLRREPLADRRFQSLPHQNQSFSQLRISVHQYIYHSGNRRPCPKRVCGVADLEKWGLWVKWVNRMSVVRSGGQWSQRRSGNLTWLQLVLVGLFWLSLLLGFYTYVGYPLLLAVLARLRPRTALGEGCSART